MAKSVCSHHVPVCITRSGLCVVYPLRTCSQRDVSWWLTLSMIPCSSLHWQDCHCLKLPHLFTLTRSGTIWKSPKYTKCLNMCFGPVTMIDQSSLEFIWSCSWNSAELILSPYLVHFLPLIIDGDRGRHNKFKSASAIWAPKHICFIPAFLSRKLKFFYLFVSMLTWNVFSTCRRCIRRTTSHLLVWRAAIYILALHFKSQLSGITMVRAKWHFKL